MKSDYFIRVVVFFFWWLVISVEKKEVVSSPDLTNKTSYHF